MSNKNPLKLAIKKDTIFTNLASNDDKFINSMTAEAKKLSTLVQHKTEMNEIVCQMTVSFCYLFFESPGMTETSYHTISIYEKLLVIQFHTYRKLYENYDKHFSIYENCMIGVFP